MITQTLSLRAFALIALTGLSVITPAVAQEVITDPAKAQAGVYELDPRHTNVSWKVSHLGFSNFVGTFEQAGGTLDFKPDDPTKSTLKVTIDPATLHTNVEGFAKELIAGGGWIDAAKGPITFVSTSAAKTSETTGTLTGDLTLNGVTKPVTFDVAFVGAGKNGFANAHAIGFSGKTTIKRSEFGVDKYVPTVGDDVTIMVESEFLQKMPEAAKQ